MIHLMDHYSLMREMMKRQKQFDMNSISPLYDQKLLYLHQPKVFKVKTLDKEMNIDES